jgi:hypothetical protein
MPETGTIVSVLPTERGQKDMLRLFAEQVMADVRKPRHEAASAILASIIDLSFTLGFNAPRDAEKAGELRERLVALVPE